MLAKLLVTMFAVFMTISLMGSTGVASIEVCQQVPRWRCYDCCSFKGYKTAILKEGEPCRCIPKDETQ